MGEQERANGHTTAGKAHVKVYKFPVTPNSLLSELASQNGTLSNCVRSKDTRYPGIPEAETPWRITLIHNQKYFLKYDI